MNTNHELTSHFGGVVLRPYNEFQDIGNVASILLDPRTWTGGFGDSTTRIPQDMEDAVQLTRERHENMSMFSIVENTHHSGEVIGATGITTWNAELETVKIGRTIIHPNFWGKQYNHEVKLVLLDWIFSMGIGRVECDVAPANNNSMRSLEKFGFTFEGVKRRAVRRSDGTWRDTAIFSMIVDEWDYKRGAVVNKLLERNDEPHGYFGLS